MQLAHDFMRNAHPIPDWCYNTLGLVEYRNNRWDEAIADLNHAAALDQEHQPLDYIFLAMAHWQKGDKVEAGQFFQKGVALFKNHPQSREHKMLWAEAAKLLAMQGPPA